MVLRKKHGYLHAKRMKLDSYLLLYPDINSEWIKDGNVNTKTIKTLRRKHRGKFCDIDFINDLLDMTAKAQTIKKTNRLRYIKI